MRVGSLFSGIGGFDLGLERAGMQVAWQCESDEFCRAVLHKHWPRIPCVPDVRLLAYAPEDVVDIICGGFPCQGLSSMGKRRGLEDERSGLWFEMARVISEYRPTWVLIENVSRLASTDDIQSVLGHLHQQGYHTYDRIIKAEDVGAPHQRRRVFIVAHSRNHGCKFRWPTFNRRQHEVWDESDRRSASMGVSFPPGPQADPGAFDRGDQPAVLRATDGLSSRMDRHRLKALGNALLPQIAEEIGRAILDTR